MDLPKLESVEIEGKRVIVRADLDVDLGTQNSELSIQKEPRIGALIRTVGYLFDKKASKIVIIGHKGRPNKENSLSLSLSNLTEPLRKLLAQNVNFVEELDSDFINSAIEQSDSAAIFLLENLRFDSREEKNDKEFAAELAKLGDVYVNEAFASSHRIHTSVAALPEQFKSQFKNSVAAGLRFAEEVENLSKVLNNPKKPVVVIVSGIKEDKLEYVEPFGKFADKVLLGGRLPDIVERGFPDSKLPFVPSDRVLVAKLNPDKEDITIKSIELFEEEIQKAGTIVVGGPVGKFEDEGQRLGTKRVFAAVAKTGAYKIAGGGDTEDAIRLLGLEDEFDWVSVGGGAMLEYLTKGTLPGIKALQV
jgi:3-phosphoglycerate kinase